MEFRKSIKLFLTVAWLSVEAEAASGAARNASMVANYQGLRRKSSNTAAGTDSGRRLQAILPEDMWPDIDYVGDGGNFEVFPLELCMGYVCTRLIANSPSCMPHDCNVLTSLFPCNCQWLWYRRRLCRQPEVFPARRKCSRAWLSRRWVGTWCLIALSCAIYRSFLFFDEFC